MTRFEREISGELGDYWKKSAENELVKLRNELEGGNITVDQNGVARNCIGRVVMSDMLEKLMYVTDTIDAEATKAARDKEVSESIAEYKKNYKGPSAEELIEMRAAFGDNADVVNILTGDTVYLGWD